MRLVVKGFTPAGQDRREVGEVDDGVVEPCRVGASCMMLLLLHLDLTELDRSHSSSDCCDIVYARVHSSAAEDSPAQGARGGG